MSVGSRHNTTGPSPAIFALSDCLPEVSLVALSAGKPSRAAAKKSVSSCIIFRIPTPGSRVRVNTLPYRFTARRLPDCLDMLVRSNVGKSGGTPVRLLVQPGDGIMPLVKAIDHAKTSVEIVIFRFDRKEIETSLAKAV